MTIRFYLLLSFSVCGWNATAEAADRFVVSPKVGAPAGNLSPVLLIIRSGGGTYVGETENGQPVFELAAESELLTRGVRFNVPFEVTPLGNRRVVEMRELLVSWTPGKRPTPAELEEVGFRVVKTHDRGTFFVVQPTRPIPLSQESIRRLSILKKVEHAEFNHRMKVIPLPAAEPFAAPGALGAPPVNDPLYPRLWGLKRIDVEPAWANLDRTPPRVADSLFNADSEIIVAVIDSGVDYRHADLMQNMWVNKGEIPGNGIDDDNNGVIDDIHGASFIGATPSGDPMDENGHGTHCAGTIGAVGNNAFGLVGVNRRIKIMALKFLDSNGGGTTADAIQCIHYAIDNGATILSNSWGGGGATREMLEAIQETRRSRLIFVAAAGNATNNNDANPSYPASYPEANIVSVAAIAEDGSLASFSNYGATSVDIAAPGVNILSTYPRDNFKSLNGTSMATPHVAGAIALLWKHPRHRDLHWQEVLKRIYSNANTSPTLEGKVAGGRVLNIGFLGQTPNPDPPTTPVPDPPDPTPRPDPNPRPDPTPIPPNPKPPSTVQPRVLAAFGQFYHDSDKAITEPSQILVVELTLKQASNVVIESNTSATSPRSPQVFSSGFGLTTATGSTDWAESFSIVSVTKSGSYVNFGSTFTVQLPIGTHRVYWKLKTPKNGEVTLRGGGSMVLKAFPAQSN